MQECSAVYSHRATEAQSLGGRFQNGVPPHAPNACQSPAIGLLSGAGAAPQIQEISLCVSVPLCEHVHAFCRLFGCKKLTLFHCRINRSWGSAPDPECGPIAGDWLVFGAWGETPSSNHLLHIYTSTLLHGQTYDLQIKPPMLCVSVTLCETPLPACGWRVRSGSETVVKRHFASRRSSGIVGRG